MKSILLCIVLLSAPPGFAARTIDKAVAESLIAQACSDEALVKTRSLFDSDVSITEEHLERRGNRFGWRRTMKFSGNHSIKLDRIAPNDHFRGVRLEWSDSKPKLFIAAGPDCTPHTTLQLNYDASGKAIELLHLDAQFMPIRSETLEPALPQVYGSRGPRIGLIDSGINYTLSIFGPHLVRDGKGQLLGYDYWDLDPLPFDSNPARSPFFPQRHGTRTASLLVKEAPDSIIVPYRYPRPDMQRMRDLIRHAARHGVSILGMPLGSNNHSDWVAFAKAAQAHPELLFVVSAGNQGRNIDQNPVYPASLPLGNLLVVTSADDYGRPAQGSNWGSNSVDLLVPAERIEVVDFEGRPIVASGSSYAVARTAALAARLKLTHPAWTSSELISEIHAMAVPTDGHTKVRSGFLTDPLADTAYANRIRTHRLKIGSREIGTTFSYRMNLHIILLKGSDWTIEAAAKMIDGAAQIFAQCALQFDDPKLHIVDASEYLLDFSTGTARTLVERVGVPAPVVYLVRNSRMEFPFDGEAFGRANSANRPWLTDSVWLLEDTPHPDIALAHELFHVLANQGDHSDQPRNLMQERTTRENRELSDAQCERALQTGLAHGLIRRVNT